MGADQENAIFIIIQIVLEGNSMIKFDNKMTTVDFVKEMTAKRQPDFNNFLKVLNKQMPERPTLFEFFLNDEINQELTGVPYPPLDNNFIHDQLSWNMISYRNAGYDYFMISIPPNISFTTKEHHKKSSLSMNDLVMIHDQESFDAYPWPDPEEIEIEKYEAFFKEVIPGMKGILYAPSGLLENTTSLLGYDNLCYFLADDPDFAKKVFDKVGSILLRYYERMIELDYVGAILVNDDWGFFSQTMLKTEDMRSLVIPWHKKYVEVAHRHGKPAMMHSCGQLQEVMDDIIDEIKFDAKHSYEDKIIPVEEAYEKWGNRIGIIGGIDVHFLCTSTPEEIFNRATALLEQTKERGGYALGSGNSIPSYVPKQNYYAMLSAALIN